MSKSSVKLVPGLNTEKTISLNEAGYTYTNMGRFRNGLFEKLGGWSKFFPNSFGSPPMALAAWEDLNTNTHLAVGLASALKVITSGSVIDLTPQYNVTSGAMTTDVNFTTTIGSNIVQIHDVNASNIQLFDAVYFNTTIYVGGIILSGLYQVVQFISTNDYTIQAASAATGAVTNGGALPTLTTSNGSATVTVTITGHGQVVGNIVVFPIGTTFNGVTVQGIYQVTTIVDANNFTITVVNTATASSGTTVNGGNVSLKYWLATGPLSAAGAYGVGNYGDGLYGLGSTPTAGAGTPITATDWTLSNWGELLVASANATPIFYWGPESGFVTVRPIGSGPAMCEGSFVSTSTQILVAYGAAVAPIAGMGIGVYQDPLWVEWSDQSNILQWTPGATVQAGGFRIPTGSKIVGGLSTPKRDLLLTDIELWSMTYIGQPYVFSIMKIGSNCGLIAKHAVCTISDAVFWMGPANFFVIDGSGVRPLPCPVWDAVFQDLNPTYINTCFAVSNSLFNEIWFFYPSLSGAATRPDKYAKFNIVEATWDVGSLSRSCGIDQSVLGNPILCSASGIVYSHETSRDADNVPINSAMETGYFSLNEGEDVAFIDQIIPDFKFGFFGGSTNANINLTITGLMYPDDEHNGKSRVYGPYTINSTSPLIIPRIRARYTKIRVESNDAGSFWRLGKVQFRYKLDGRR